MRTKLVAAIDVALAGGVGLGGTAGTAAAQTEEEIEAREIAAVASAKVGLSEAIAAAEKQLGGKVVAGGLEVDADRLFYELLVSKGGGSPARRSIRQRAPLVRRARPSSSRARPCRRKAPRSTSAKPSA
jgi:hypothetical protein